MKRFGVLQKRASQGPWAALTALSVIVALAVPFAGSAVATHEGGGGSDAPDVIDLSPASHSAASGTCNQYTITAYENTTNTVHPAEGETIDIRATQQDSDNLQDVKISFCDPDGSGRGSDLSGSGQPPAGSQTQGGGVTSGDCDDENNVPNNDPGVAGCNNQTGPEANAIVHEECRTASDGTCVFGLTSNESGTMNITACYESVSENNECAGEPVNDPAVKTWTPGGPEAARSISCVPASDTNPEGTSHTFQCTVSDSGGQPLGGVTVTYDVTAGPNADEWLQTTCGPTDNNGRTPVGAAPTPAPTGSPGPNPTGTPGQANSSCTYTDNTSNTNTPVNSPPGTDTVTFWVQQQAGGTIGPDASEPKTTATKTWSGTARTLDCEPEADSNPPGTTHTVTCTARDVAANPVSGVTVRFSESGAGRFSTPSGCNEQPNTTSCDLTTGSTGQVQAVVSTATNELGDQAITGTIVGSNPAGATAECARVANDPAGAPPGACSDTVIKTWANPTPTPPTEVRHARTVNVSAFDHVRIPAKRTRGLIVRGRVSTPDGFSGCHSAVAVKVQMRVGGRWVTRKTDVTNDRGVFKVLIRDVAARYRVIAPKHQIDDTAGSNQIHICQRASDVRRHRH